MAKYMPEKRFSFISTAASLNEETFGVVQFSGVEGISLPYEFDIMLVSDNPEIDLDDIMAVPARFTIHRKEGNDVDFHGILDSFEQLHKYNEYIFYRAHLVPRLWWLSITHHNQVCLKKTVTEIVELALKDSGLSTLDFEFKIRGNYNPIDYVCQYNESHFNFISRWLEREGLYYYFDQKGPAEKIIFTDTHIVHTDLPDVHYAPPSGLLETESTEIINSFICRQRQLPQKIYLKDHNYERPSLGISGSADVDQRGRGTDYVYGEYFPNSEEGNRLAGIRAETLNCRKREFIGESTVPFMEPGYTLSLHRHYRESFNQRYLVESVSHDGNQVGYLIPSVLEGLPGHKHTVYYRNNFTAIPADIQFRPERKAVKPRIAGTLHAVIDAEGSGQYAELDNQGRYKVRLPFDESDEHNDGKASAYLRMMQPYANQSGGMQFPLTKGTEVLLTFIDGDPDRPVIAGAVANPETPSPVTAKNQTESVIQTGGNNKIRIEDKVGKERIIMESPAANSWVRIGAPNDPPAVDLDGDGTDEIDSLVDPNNAAHKIGIRMRTDESLWIEAEQKYGEYWNGFPTPPSPTTTDIEGLLANFGSNYNPSGCLSRGDKIAQNHFLNDVVKNAHVHVSKLDTVNTQEGNIYDFGGYWSYNLGNSFDENHISQSAHLNLKNSFNWPSSLAGVSETDYQVIAGITGGAALVAQASIFMTSGIAPHFSSIGGAIAGSIVNAGFAAGVGCLFLGIVDGVSQIGPEGQNFQGNVGDVIDGPGSNKEIKTWAKSVGSSINSVTNLPRNKPADDYKNKKNGTVKSNMNTDTTWVSKEFGDSYNYSRGNDISIRVGHTEEHIQGNTYEFVYGGMHEETKFNGAGRKVNYELGGGGTRTEINWHHVTGKLTSFEYKDNSWFSYTANFVTMPTMAISTSLSMLRANIDVSAGALDISAKLAAGMKIDIEATAGLGVKFERSVGGMFVNDETTSGFEFKAMGMRAAKEAALKAEAKNLVMEKVLTSLKDETMNVVNSKLEIKGGALTMDNKAFKFF